MVLSSMTTPHTAPAPLRGLPTLEILPLALLVLHENHDRQRTLPLVDKLRAQGILRNPPVVMPLTDGTGRYMVLDGANRVTALQEMEFPHIVVQVVDHDGPNIQLETWNHVVWGMQADELLTKIREVAGLKLRPVERGANKREEMGRLPVEIQLATGQTYLTSTTKAGLHLAAYLHGIVDTYKDISFLDRTMQADVDYFKEVYSDLTALFVYPRFEIKFVLDLAGQGHILPAGLTRFTVSPRALHLNYPLHELSSGKPLAYKMAYLTHWVQERIKNKNVRYYAEATFLYDE
jgi:hypothetical protein